MEPNKNLQRIKRIIYDEIFKYNQTDKNYLATIIQSSVLYLIMSREEEISLTNFTNLCLQRYIPKTEYPVCCSVKFTNPDDSEIGIWSIVGAYHEYLDFEPGIFFNGPCLIGNKPPLSYCIYNTTYDPELNIQSIAMYLYCNNADIRFGHYGHYDSLFKFCEIHASDLESIFQVSYKDAARIICKYIKYLQKSKLEKLSEMIGEWYN